MVVAKMECERVSEWACAREAECASASRNCVENVMSLNQCFYIPDKAWLLPAGLLGNSGCSENARHWQTTAFLMDAADLCEKASIYIWISSFDSCIHEAWGSKLWLKATGGEVDYFEDRGDSNFQNNWVGFNPPLSNHPGFIKQTVGRSSNSHTNKQYGLEEWVCVCM